MPGKYEDFLMGPVVAKFCTYAEMFVDEKFDLLDVVRMNDAIAVVAENNARAREASEVERENNKQNRRK